jgi:hypothetical protein
MNLTQLLITGGAVVGIIVIGLLAIIPSLLDYPPRFGRSNPPLGRDQDDPDLPAPPTTPNQHRRRHRDHLDLAA